MRIAVIGAGGQAREVEFVLRELGLVCAGFVISDLGRIGPYDSRERILGDFSWLESHRGAWDGLAIGIGTPAARLRVADRLEAMFGEHVWPVLVHPSVVLDRVSCVLERGAYAAPGATMTVGVRLGAHSMLNTNVTMGHEASLGRGSVVNPGANIGGGVAIGAGSLVGTGAQVLQYRKVGDGATVGAGAVVTRDVGDGTTVVGVPARVR